MLTVTESAKNELSTYLEGKQTAGALRLLATTEGRLALIPDRPRSGDEIHEHDGKPLIVIDERVSSAIGAHTLDVATDAGELRFTLL